MEKDIIKDSVKEAISERIKNPILGSFSIAWLIINWKPIAILIKSELPILETIAYIEKTYMSHGTLYIMPLSIALFYTVIYPWLTLLVMLIRTIPQFLMDKKKIEDEMRLAEMRLRIEKINEERYGYMYRRERAANDTPKSDLPHMSDY